MRDGKTIGRFYNESMEMRNLFEKLKVESFEMLTVASSVIRPEVDESVVLLEFI